MLDLPETFPTKSAAFRTSIPSGQESFPAGRFRYQDRNRSRAAVLSACLLSAESCCRQNAVLETPEPFWCRKSRLQSGGCSDRDMLFHIPAFGYIQNAFEKIFQTIKGRLKVPSSGACSAQNTAVSFRRRSRQYGSPASDAITTRCSSQSLITFVPQDYRRIPPGPSQGYPVPTVPGPHRYHAPHGSQSTAALQQHPIVCRKFPASADLALILLGHGLLHRRYINCLNSSSNNCSNRLFINITSHFRVILFSTRMSAPG